MRALPVDALSGVLQVRALPVDALSGVPQVREFPVDPFPVVKRPRTLPGTPPRADPATEAPCPPARDLGVGKVRLTLAPLNDPHAFRDQPQMPRGKVGFVNRIIGVESNCFRVMLHRSPEVGDEMVLVVDGLYAGCVRPVEQHGAGTKERLDVVCDGTEPRPHVGGDAGFPAEIGEWGFHASGNSSLDQSGHSSAVFPTLTPL